MTKKQYFLFHSTQSAIMAERICREAGLAVAAVPVPRELSAECGIALESGPEALSPVKETLKRNRIPFTHAEI